jgi:23S rRNA (uracil1939-C5)-methyltransferase
VPITECHVLTPGLLAVVPVLGEITRLGGSRSGVMSFAMTQTDSGVDLRVSGGKPLDGPLRMALGAFSGSFVRLTWEDEPIFAAMPPLVRFGATSVTPPPGAFLQATAEGEAALLTAVQEAVAGRRASPTFSRAAEPSPCRSPPRLWFTRSRGRACCSTGWTRPRAMRRG